jgi:hypothetical protein
VVAVGAAVPKVVSIVPVEVMLRGDVMTIVNVTLSESAGLDVSVAVTVTVYDPPDSAPGVPDIAPAVIDNPTGSTPEVML